MRTARELEVAQGLGVDREDAAGRPVLGSHVGDRGPIGQRQRGQAVAVVLDELAHHALLAEHLGHGEDQVGGRGTFGKRAGQLEADDLGNEHRHRLAEHRRLGLDAADAPAQNAQAVDHRGVRVGPDQRVGIRQRLLARRAGRGEDDPGQVLQVHLVDDSGVGRHDLEVLERILAPAEERVPLAVAAGIRARR